jgi:hypothetical protein
VGGNVRPFWICERGRMRVSRISDSDQMKENESIIVHHRSMSNGRVEKREYVAYY